MGRKEKRAAKALEKNPVRECNMIQNKFLPGLMNKFLIPWIQEMRHTLLTLPR